MIAQPTSCAFFKPPRKIEAIVREPGSDIMVFGSATILSRLSEMGLVDTYDFVVNPVFLGRGRNLFDEVAVRSKLRLVDAETYPSGSVVLRYTRAG